MIWRATVICVAIIACGSKRDDRAADKAEPQPAATKPVKLTGGEVGTETCDRLVKFERACLATLPKDDELRVTSEDTLQRSIDSWNAELATGGQDAIPVIDGVCAKALAVLVPQMKSVCPSVSPEGFGIR